MKDLRPRSYPAAGRPFFGRLWVILRPHGGMFAGSALLGALQQTLVVAAAAWSAHLVSKTVLGAASRGSDPPGRGLGLLVVLVLAGGGLQWVKTVVEADLAHRILTELRAWLFDAFERLGPLRVGAAPGERATTALADVARLDWLFARFLPACPAAVLVPLAAVVALAALHAWLAASLLPYLALAVVIPVTFRRRALTQGDELRQAHARLDAETLDGIRGVREILAFGRGGDWLDHLDRRGGQLARAQQAYGAREGLETALGGAVASLGSLSVLALAARLVVAGALPAERLPVALILALAAFLPIQGVAAAAARLGLVGVSARRLFELLDLPSLEAGPVVGTCPAVPARSGIEFRGVRFRYRLDRPEVLKGLDLRISPGETVALVGASGAGKTTCVHLLLRFLEPDSGSIALGGVDLRQLDPEAVRRHIAWVPQEVHLFDETLRENLRLGAPEATDRDIEEALRAAAAADLVAGLPQGLDSRPGEGGVRLSGGQRQRLAIARALLMRAPVLVLDEATSNLDAENEWRLRQALEELRGRSTLLIVAHRLATVRRADRIVVLEDGRAVEAGRHRELLARRGAYARLVGSQLEPLAS